MSLTLTPAEVAVLRRLAARITLEDKGWEVNDVAAGNIDDAFERGTEDGGTELARSLLRRSFQ